SAALATDGQLKAEIWSWSRARGLFAGVALDRAVLSIDDEANQAVYGPGTTPRLILEDRAANAPSTAIVDFRAEREEATAAPGPARGVGTAPQPVAAQPPMAEPSQTATTAIGTQPADPQPQPFETVDDNPATTEPLPPVQ